MSVLIKGMEMPITCWDCFLRKDCNEIIIWSKRRPSKCPLVEVPTPHGRLIDADALEEEAQKRILICNKSGNQFQKPYEILRVIALAPTIIESEDE